MATHPNQQTAALRPITFDVRPLDSTPVVIREWKVDWDSLFAKLTETGKPVLFPVPEGMKWSSVNTAIHAAAVRRGMNVSVRNVGGEVCLSIRAKKSNTRSSQRNQDIIAAIESGETLQAVAHRYSLTRQRIEQIAVRRFNEMPFGRGRKEASIEFLQPYLVHIGKNYCPVCGDELENKGWLCASCKTLQRVIRDIKSHLRGSQRGYEQGRRQAIYLIRKHHIKPEHLMGRKAEGK